jgi:hypothetical protein
MKRVLGWSLVSSPLVGLGVVMATRGHLNEFLLAMVTVGVVALVLLLGVHLILSE